MIITKKIPTPLPFEEGKVYKTKFATGESFLLVKIKRDKKDKIIGFDGIYENSKSLGICHLSIDRLIPETNDFEIIEVCSKCGESI